MDGYTLTVVEEGASHSARARQGQSLLAALREAGVYLPAICGGSGTCGKCRVRLAAGTLPPSPADTAFFTPEEIQAGQRLTCTAFPGGDVTVEVPKHGEDAISAVTGQHEFEPVGPTLVVRQVAIEKSKTGLAEELAGDAIPTAPLLAQCSGIMAAGAQNAFVARDGGRVLHIGAEKTALYGVAVDIGTTTLGFALVDLLSGEVVRRQSAINRQRRFGADVITRIVRANEGDLAAQTESIRAQMGENVLSLCRAQGVAPAQVVKMAVAGNTTMLHLLLGLSCAGLGVFPFKPVTLAHVRLPYKDLFGDGPGCEVDILPGISTYVGADITAGILFTGLPGAQRPALLVDIGTNGEMALAYGGRLLCTSTAAGPAFEGGNISCGTGSVPGAISAVSLEGGAFRIKTIDDAPPVGICGSGVIDTVYALLRGGKMDETGAFEDDGEAVPLARMAGGGAVTFTQKDVRELQLGKSAIRSGIDTLLARAGLAYDDIGALMLAGGFGYRINIESAVGIGMLPAAFAGKTIAVGNASLGGAVHFIVNSGKAEEMLAVAAEAEEFGLSEDARFNDLFVENMMFE